jgi:ABC-type molybdate transport system substrate-binding protein
MATIKVMSAGAVESMLKAIGAEFEQASGHKIDFVFNTAGGLRERFLSGDISDLLVLPDAAIQAFMTEGHIKAGTRTPLASAVSGVVVGPRAPQPGKNNVEAVKPPRHAAKARYKNHPKAGG